MAGQGEMMRRQRALAEFGDFVLDHEDLDEILNEGCRLIALALDADLAKVIEIQRDSHTGLVRAGVGWAPGIVGHERVELSEASSEAYAIETAQPVITNDIANETRFVFPRFLIEHGVVALVNVPILLPGRRPWGVLQVDAREVRAFDQEDIEFLKTYAMVLGPVIDRLRVAVEREAARHGMAEREDQLRTVLEGMGEQFYVLDREGRFQFASRSALRAWGREGEDLLGRGFLDCFPEAAGSQPYRAYERVMAGGPAEHFKTLSPILHRWIEVGIDPTSSGGVSVVLRDVEDREQATQALRESEERLRSAIEVGKLGLWDWNLQTGEAHWSDQHFRLQGYEVGEVTPSYAAWVAHLHPDDRAASEAALKRAMDSREEYVSEFRVVHPTGAVRWLHARGRFFYDGAGRAVRMIGAMVDTTERRELEDRQQVLVAELQHRTRNLIGVIRFMADKTARSSADFDDFRTRFRDRLDAMARVQGLLSRLNEHDRVTFDALIETELTAMDDGLQRTSLSGPRGVRLRSSTVQTLAMALHELATNAVKYGALGQAGARLVVHWRFEPSDAEGRPWLHIDWRESGVAMPPAGGAPTGSGQGRELIEQALPYQLRARTSYELGPDGVHCTISVPVSETSVALETADG